MCLTAALSEQPFSLGAKRQRIFPSWQGLWRTVGLESNCQSLCNNLVVNLPSDDIVRKGTTLLQEEGDAYKAICTKKGRWWGVARTHTEATIKVSAPTIGPSWSCARRGIWGKRGLESWRQGRASFRFSSERLSSPLEFRAWQSEKLVSSPGQTHPLAKFDEQGSNVSMQVKREKKHYLEAFLCLPL